MPYKDPAKRREANLAAVRRYQASNPAKCREQQRRYHERYGSYANARRRARLLVQKAVKAGRLVREACLFCDNPDVHAHHHDYSKPLDVTWLCPLHHGLVHRAVVV